jgi:hypothetical protein
MRSRRERRRERMSGAEIKRRMRFLLFGLSSSSRASLCIGLASSLLEARRPAKQRQPQMRSRRERSREKMSGAEIKRRMRFLLFGLASSSSSS